MAEFQEVMKQWRRMCDACTCSNRKELEGLPMCPIVLKHCGYPCDDSPQYWSEEDTKQFEEIVMQWAAEHPEPVYPTWVEWFNSMGGVDCGTPMPADIAQKLGIEPKEGV